MIFLITAIVQKDIYRATGVVLLNLEPDASVQYSLFDNPLQAEKIRDIYNVADELGRKFGKHTLHLGSSHPIDKSGKGRRGSPTIREQTQLKGETRPPSFMFTAIARKNIMNQ